MPSNLTVALTPLAFCASVNFGMTQSVIHCAPSAFLPPATELDVMVSVTSLASELRPVLESCCCPRHPERTSVADTVADTAAASTTFCRMWAPSSSLSCSRLTAESHQPRVGQPRNLLAPGAL